MECMTNVVCTIAFNNNTNLYIVSKTRGSGGLGRRDKREGVPLLIDTRLLYATQLIHMY